MQDDRRKNQRAAIRTIVRMQFETIGEFLQSYAQNISATGMKLAVAQELATDDLIAIEFKLKSSYPLIQSTARVKWCEAADGHFMIGVEFDDLDERSKNTIQEAIAIQQRTSGKISALEGETSAYDIETSDLLAPPEEDSASSVADFGDLSFDDEPAAASTSDGLELESLELPEAPAVEDDVEPFDFSDDIETSDAPAPIVFDDDAVEDLFDDTSAELEEAAPNKADQLDFGTGFGAATSDDGVETVVADTMPKTTTAKTSRKPLLIATGVVLLVAAGAVVWLMSSGERQPEMQAAIAPEPELSVAVAAPTAPTQAMPSPLPEIEVNSPVPTPVENLPEPQPVLPTPAPQPAPIERTPPPPPTHVKSQTTAAARKIVKIEAGSGQVWLTMTADGNLDGKYKFFSLANPPRAVVDLLDVEVPSGLSSQALAANPAVQSVRIGRHPDKVRFVLDLSANRGFDVELDGHQLVVRGK